MKLPTIPWLLIDEFPETDIIELCIFTRPQYPIEIHRNEWNENLKFLCSESAYLVFSMLDKQIPHDMLMGVENSLIIPGTGVSMKFIESDEVRSLMIIIERTDEPNERILYTGQFTSYRYALFNGLIDEIDKITDVYLDNSLASIGYTNSLAKACREVDACVKKYKDYKIYINMDDLFGYEEILLMLARNYHMKIKLHDLQMVEMENAKLSHLFEFKGNPDLTVFFSTQEKLTFTSNKYKRFFEEKKYLFLRFIGRELDVDFKSIGGRTDGLIMIPYSPHPSPYTLAGFLQTVKPNRVHPLIQADFSADPSIVIPKEMLPNGCELIIFEKTSSAVNNSFSHVERTIYEENSSKNINSNCISSRAEKSDSSECSHLFLASSESLPGSCSDQLLDSSHSISLTDDLIEIEPAPPKLTVHSRPIEGSDEEGIDLLPIAPKRSKLCAANNSRLNQINKVKDSISVFSAGDVQPNAAGLNDSATSSIEILTSDDSQQENEHAEGRQNEGEVNNNRSVEIQEQAQNPANASRSESPKQNPPKTRKPRTNHTLRYRVGIEQLEYLEDTDTDQASKESSTESDDSEDSRPQYL